MSALAQHIDTAADAVRDANHATMRSALDAPESYAVVGNLVVLVHRLPQVLDFLSRSLRRADPVEHYDDRGHDAEQTLSLACDALAAARDGVGDVTRRLNAAHIHLGHLGRHLAED